ncbi:MAG: hypothetical protein LAT67_10580 [Balneolales bacterium]|nr:hypothetical protein [Balneolales bacterium]
MDFNDDASVSIINQWASDNTNGLIDSVVDELDPDDVMVLMNALYFKGSWSARFKASDTEMRPFTLMDGSETEVPTMFGEVNLLTAMGDGYLAVEIPYGRKNFSMVIILPDTHDFERFRNDFSAADWAEATTYLGSGSQWRKAELYLPKFSFRTSGFDLNTTLQQLGMHDAFNPSLADFSPISDTQIFVGDVKQDSFIKVNEEGTEAAAVTTIGIRVTSVGPDETPVIRIDRPFLFGIRERTTNTLLFMGQKVVPE